MIAVTMNMWRGVRLSGEVSTQYAPAAAKMPTNESRLAGLGDIVIKMLALFIGSSVLNGLAFFGMAWSGQHVLRQMRIDILQQAHRLRYQKALADLISKVKHAAREESPLLTADEREAVSALFVGQSGVRYAKKISVTADKIVCRVSNVDITARSCELTFKGARQTGQVKD